MKDLWSLQLILLRSRSSKNRKEQILALERSCQSDIAISIFSDTSCVPWTCPSGSAFIYVGPFQFMEWRSHLEVDRIVLQRQADSITRREIHYTAPKQADLSSDLFLGIACTSCLCALSATIWSGWSCPYCNTFVAAPPVREQLHRLFAKVNISYTGPRMDNGKAYVDMSMGVKRRLAVWNDGLKVSCIFPDCTVSVDERDVDFAL